MANVARKPMLTVPYSEAVMTKIQMCVVIAPFAKKISDSDKFDAKADNCKMGDYCEKFSCDTGVESEVQLY